MSDNNIHDVTPFLSLHHLTSIVDALPFTPARERRSHCATTQTVGRSAVSGTIDDSRLSFETLIKTFVANDKGLALQFSTGGVVLDAKPGNVSTAVGNHQFWETLLALETVVSPRNPLSFALYVVPIFDGEKGLAHDMETRAASQGRLVAPAFRL